MKVLTVVGARPQFVKASAVSPVLREQHTEYLVHTGQHYDDGMSSVFFRELGLPEPDANLGVGSGLHGAQTGAMLTGLEDEMLKVQPDWVLVYGDTNSTLAGALAAAKLNIPVAHVEAGLRSYRRDMPEEINRVITDYVATLRFCPTQRAADNLAREGITAGVHVTGDVMVDVVRRYTDHIWKRPITDDANPYLVATFHRPVNTEPQMLGKIIEALNSLSMRVVFPMHPRTRKIVNAYRLHLDEHVKAVKPVSYLDMLALMYRAEGVITDSGGLQKEAYLLEVPCVTVRDETEWAETVEVGWNRLCKPEIYAIREAVNAICEDDLPTVHPALYGDGHAAEKIVAALEAT